MKSVRISEAIHAKLAKYKDRHNHRSYSDSIEWLLKMHPDAPGSRSRREPRTVTPTATHPEESEKLETESASLLKKVIITRLVVEGRVSVNRVPLVQALCHMLCDGKVEL